MKKLLLALCVPFCLSGNAVADDAAVEALKERITTFARLAYGQAPNKETTMALTDFYNIGMPQTKVRRSDKRRLQERILKGMEGFPFCTTGVRNVLFDETIRIRTSPDGYELASAEWTVECNDGKKLKAPVIQFQSERGYKYENYRSNPAMPVVWVKYFEGDTDWRIPVWNFPSNVANMFANLAFVDKDYARAFNWVSGYKNWSAEEKQKSLEILETMVEDGWEKMSLDYNCKSLAVGVPVNSSLYDVIGNPFSYQILPNQRSVVIALKGKGCLKDNKGEIAFGVPFDETNFVDWKRLGNYR